MLYSIISATRPIALRSSNSRIAGAARIAKLLQWAEAGKIRPHISHRLPLEDVAPAMRLLIDRKAIGRVALMMG